MQPVRVGCWQSGDIDLARRGGTEFNLACPLTGLDKIQADTCGTQTELAPSSIPTP
jgi:hypothetical protein